jgi:hypothetical protein
VRQFGLNFAVVPLYFSCSSLVCFCVSVYFIFCTACRIIILIIIVVIQKQVFCADLVPKLLIVFTDYSY